MDKLVSKNQFQINHESHLNTKDLGSSRSIKLCTPIEHPVTSEKICLMVSSHSFADKYLKKVDTHYFIVCF